MDATDYTVDVATFGDVEGKLSCKIVNPETEWKSDNGGSDGSTHLPARFSFCGAAAPSAPTLEIELSSSVVLLALSWTSSAKSVEVHATGTAECSGVSLLGTVSCVAAEDGTVGEFAGSHEFSSPSARGSTAARQVKLKFFGRQMKNQWQLTTLRLRMADQVGSPGNQPSRQRLEATSPTHLGEGAEESTENLRPTNGDTARSHSVAAFQEALLASLQPIMVDFQSFATRVEERFDRLEARIAVVERRTEELLQVKSNPQQVQSSPAEESSH
jgi:hypothetical protein